MRKRVLTLLISIFMIGVPAAASADVSPQAVAPSGRYVALGDSVAAGLGLAPITNASAADTSCGRSSQSYPYLVAQQRQLQLIDAACSGATVGDLYTSQRLNDEVSMPAQLDTAFAQGPPQLITITAGANDVHWADFLSLCQSYNCNTAISNLVLNGYRMVLSGKLTYALDQISQRSGSAPPQVILTGYYNPISNFCKGGKLAGITDDEIDWLNSQRDAINQTIRDVASNYPFASYASADFTGHGICAAEPWSQTMSEAAPLHPTVAGQQQIAQSVLSRIRQ